MKDEKLIPMFMPGQALQSMRQAGYDLPAALGEPIDNSLEAGANAVHLRLEESANKKGKKHIDKIAILDDGSGMDEATLWHYLQLGFSTRYMSTTTIGKFGVGAKLAALNFARRVDVWSRRSKDEEWLHVHFDLIEALDQEKLGGGVGIARPRPRELPGNLQQYASKGAGTVVLWSSIDRLDAGRHAPDLNALRVEIEKELSRIFRYFLRDGRKILINDLPLLPHDPLFRMDRTWGDQVLSESTDDERHHEPAQVILDDEPIRFGDAVAKVTMTVLPVSVVRPKGKGGDEIARKLRIPDNQGAISFVRLEREISYTNVPKVFPGGVQDKDRYIGVQVSFPPALDESFGVRNVKRGVEPHGELRTKIRKLLEKFLPEARKKIDEIWGQHAREQEQQPDAVNPVVAAANQADRTLPRTRALPPPPEEKERILDDLATDAGKTEPQEKEEYLARVQDLPFQLLYVDFPGTNFIDIQHLGTQTIIRLNRRHRFYRELWQPIFAIAQRPPSEVTGDEAVAVARRTHEALTLMLMAYSKSEAMHETPHDHYGDLRNFWGQFLDSLMSKVKNVA